MRLYKRIFIISLTMSRNPWKTYVYSEMNIFLNLFENFKTGVAFKRLACKKRANSNLIADRSNFLVNKTARLFLELYM